MSFAAFMKAALARVKTHSPSTITGPLTACTVAGNSSPSSKGNKLSLMYVEVPRTVVAYLPEDSVRSMMAKAWPPAIVFARIRFLGDREPT